MLKEQKESLAKEEKKFWCGWCDKSFKQNVYSDPSRSNQVRCIRCNNFIKSNGK